MKLKNKKVVLGLAIIVLAGKTTLPIYAESYNNISDTFQTGSVESIEPRDADENIETVMMPSIETIMYYIQNHWTQVYSFLLRHFSNPDVIPLSEKIRILRQFWGDFINSFKPIDVYSM